MRWRRGAGGGVEDRRGLGGAALPIGAGGGGIGLIILLLVVLLGGGGNGGFDIPLPGQLPSMPAQGTTKDAPDTDTEEVQFVRFVVNDVQTSWEKAFRRVGRRYEPTTLVLFTRAVDTGCGLASSDTGPFYCPRDRHVYLDLGFFRELRDRFGAPGDFAQAYVIAHEFGHHVQNLLGIFDRVEQAQQLSPEDRNALSVRLELQADCLAGVWANSARRLLEPGDLDEGLNAAAAVGDDRIQQEAGQRIDRETFTHGSSEQRQRWFEAGFEGGDINACDTFSGDV
jgi:predicted metalloprotease